MADEDELDYQAIWERIKAAAECSAWQEDWHGSRHYFDADEAYLAQRRAYKAEFRRTFQRFDLAEAINKGDIASYIARWHWNTFAPPNGPAPSHFVYGEGSVFINHDEAASIPEGTWEKLGTLRSGSTIVTNNGEFTFWCSSADDPPAHGWKARGAAFLRSCKARCHFGNGVPTRQQGSNRVGLRARAWQSWHQVWNFVFCGRRR